MAPTPRPNYADIIARLDALTISVASTRDRPDLDEWRREIEKTLLLQTEKLSNVETLLRASLSAEAESQRCPYRDSIRRAENNVERLKTVEEGFKCLQDLLTNIRLDMAKAGVYGGGVVGGIGLLGLAIAKALKWI